MPDVPHYRPTWNGLAANAAGAYNAGTMEGIGQSQIPSSRSFGGTARKRWKYSIRRLPLER